jgi:3-hydroxyacyl-[acyl-carrier-protein] dehydratase
MKDMDDTKKPITPEPGAKLGTADIARILKLLPHRYPFLLVDRIIDMDRDESAIGIKNVSVNEPFFQGHFPSFPVMPGVLLIEGMAQTAGALCVHSIGENYEPALVFFMGIDGAKFRKPVMPGDTVHYHVKKIRSRGRAWRFYCEAKVGGQLVAEAEISAMIVDKDQAAQAAAK